MALKQEACKYGHPFVEANIYYWKREDGRLKRCCRTCRKLRRQDPTIIGQWKEWRSSYIKTDDYRKKISARHFKKKYGLTLEDVGQLYKKQRGRCAICRSSLKLIIPDRRGLPGFCIDHDHDTGKVRGILCNPCNWGLGQFKDDPFILGSAFRYLKKHKE